MKHFSYLLLSFFICLNCKTGRKSNFSVEKFTGVTLEGVKLVFKDIITPRIALNVYSPTCIPCFKEIPTLNYLSREMKRQGLGELYMVVDPINVLERETQISKEDRLAKVKEIMSNEKEKRKIELPIVIMDEPFQVLPPPSKEGLITGTPETLLLKTNPITLYYNFIGSICEKENLDEIANDAKVKFFKKQLGGI